MINKQQITLVLAKLNEYKSLLSDTDAIELGKADFCIDVLERFEANYEEWIKSCPLSNHSVSKYISEKYIGANGISDELYLSCARFLREYVFLLERKGIRESWVNGDWSLFRSNAAESIRPENRLYLDYILNGRFDIDILNNLLGDRSYEAFLNYEKNLKEYEEKSEIIQRNLTARTSRLESFLEDKEKKVNALANLLEKYKTAFNFVGLYDGFNNLSEIKNNQKKATYYFSIFLGFLLILIPFLSIILQSHMGFWVSDTVFDFKTLTVTSQFNWVKILPVLGLEFILIYFFRIVLNRLNTLQTEIIQIELRKSLCQFIQEYAKYAKELREQSSSDSQEKIKGLS
ncbi:MULTISPECIES: hypothetical protein [unclassified Mannheimia]|uniref:hypothetical protein n=1 Tax=unclassified Mannheimia TaxID=2645054 RepID=UPI00359D67A5